jgi:hypothetical protein
MPIRLPRFLRDFPITDTKKGTPTISFHEWWDTVLKQIEASISRIEIALSAAGIALGQAGQALTVVIRQVTTTGAVLDNDYLILANATAGNITLNLPAVAGNLGALVVVKKTDASVNTVTIDPNAAETIDGTATKVLSAQYEKITIACDGTTWWIVA